MQLSEELLRSIYDDVVIDPNFGLCRVTEISKEEKRIHYEMSFEYFGQFYETDIWCKRGTQDLIFNLECRISE